MRIYRIKKDHKAVRLTFHTGAQEYWGIQQTTWDDAPVLWRQERHPASGTDFDLYYDGASLHMVVLKTD